MRCRQTYLLPSTIVNTVRVEKRHAWSPFWSGCFDILAIRVKHSKTNIFPGAMFFAPAARGLVSLESGDLMACEIVPVPCECWAIATPTGRKMFARTYDTLLKFRGQSRAQDRMIWIGIDRGRDCYVLQTYRLYCKWFAPRNRRDDLDFHTRAFAASTTCASLPVAPHVPVAHAFARAGARKPRRVAACRLHSDRFRWAKHDFLINDRQSSVDCCIVGHVT